MYSQGILLCWCFWYQWSLIVTLAIFSWCRWCWWCGKRPWEKRWCTSKRFPEAVKNFRCTWDGVPCVISQLQIRWLMWRIAWSWVKWGSLTRLKKTYVMRFLLCSTLFSARFESFSSTSQIDQRPRLRVGWCVSLEWVSTY